MLAMWSIVLVLPALPGLPRVSQYNSVLPVRRTDLDSHEGQIMIIQQYQCVGGWEICCRVREWVVIEVLLNLYMVLILGSVLMVIVNGLAELKSRTGWGLRFPLRSYLHFRDLGKSLQWRE